MSGVRNARDTLRAGFTTVRDVGTFWAFVDVALRDAIDAGWTPGPRMQCAGAYITCPGGGGEVTGEAPTMGLPDGLRFGVVRDPAEVRAKVRALVAGGADRHQVHRHGRRADARHATSARSSSRSRWSGPRSRRPRRTALYVAAHAHGDRGDQGRDPGRRPLDRARLAHRRRGDRDARRHRHVLGRRRLRRRLDRRRRAPGRLAGRDDGEERRDDPGAARRVPQGRRGGRPARLRHRQRRLPAPDGGDPARLPGPPRARRRGRRSAPRR